MVPTIGAALFIWSGFDNSLFNRSLLNSKVVLWLGKISYSAYLVHWPILAFYRYGYGEPSLGESVVILFTILLLAWLNWKFVEEKFRHLEVSRFKLFVNFILAPCLIVTLLSIFVIKTDGLGVRIGSTAYIERLSNVENYPISANKYDYICQFWRIEEKHFNNPDCVLGSNKQTTVLLWGDSNATHYIGLIGSIARKQNWSFRNIAHAGCPPIFYGISNFVEGKRLDDCGSSLSLIKTKISNYKTIFVSASYDHYSRKHSNFLTNFEKTILMLAENRHKIFIIGKAPVFNKFDRNCFAKSLSYIGVNCFAVEQSYKTEIEGINLRLSIFANKYPNIKYLDFNSEICAGNSCSPYKDGRPIYFDNSHIEISSSWALGESLTVPKLEFFNE
ncbi:acyltransferase family protein [Psychrosphaera algicola]|uniref:Acyltransferase family protein n=1 Tax=Psychrosphaera algicola TaxID=3023714 RepID=A0ABT5FG27_9GAMM|nr:acyltransferase family protein [Psychrosphaera sp. G1-22]MDC2890029.1 acyltransferase family protein [Psychrosphaera sp. G1-22]